MVNYPTLRRDVPAFLRTLRHAVDRPFKSSAINDDANSEGLLRTILLIEETRIRFDTYLRYYPDPTAEQWREMINGVYEFLDNLIKTEAFGFELLNRPFFDQYVSTLKSKSTFLSNMSEDVTIFNAIILFRAVVDRANATAGSQPSLTFSDLAKIVPQQQLAPARFKIVNNRIAIQHVASHALEEDRSNIQSSLEYIQDSGTTLIRSLEQSNCDRRLLDSVRELHSQIADDGNIVKIGLTNLACGVMASQFQPELSDALFGMISAYSSSISFYVAQFPEWEQFTRRAASIEFDQVDIAEIDAAAVDVISALEENPEIAEPEVPKTIKLVRELMAAPGTTAKRAAFAMMRTIENLVSSILRYAASTIDKTAEKAIDDVSAAASKIIVGMLGVALIGATGIGSAAMQAGAPWVRQAAELVQRQIEDLAAK